MGNDQQRVEIVCSMCAMLLLEVVWGWLWLGTGVFRGLLPASVNSDILYYLSSVLLAFLSFLGFHAAFKGRLPLFLAPDGRREHLVEAAALFLFAFAAGNVFLCEKNVRYGGAQHVFFHQSPGLEYAFLVLAAVLLCTVCCLCRKRRFRDAQGRKLWPFYLALAALAGYAVYQPNTLNNYFSLYHANAYFHSIYRVVHLQPYDAVNTGVYGFYGILVGPFVKLLGGSFGACMAILAVMTAGCMLCYFYVLDHMTSNTWVRMLGGVGIVAVVTAWSSDLSLQSYPGRILFQGYMLALLVWKEQQGRREKKLWKISALALGVLSFVWGLETGAACVLALVGSEVVFLLQQDSIWHAAFWRKAAGAVLWLPVSFLGAFGFVNLYDLAVAGKLLSLREFLFPFVGNPYVNDLRLELESFPSFWMLVCALFFAAIGVVLLSTDLCGKRGANPRMIYLTGCTITGIVQMVYYVNRSVRGNLFLILPVCMLIAACLIETLFRKSVWERQEAGNGLLRAVAASQLLVLVLVTGMTVEGTLSFEMERQKAKVRDMDEVAHYVEIMRNEIPANTPGVGIGVTELYSYLGWDTGYYGIDAPDFPVAPEAKDAAVEFLTRSEYVFVNDDSLMTILDHTDGELDDFYDSHEVLCSYGFGVSSYTFYKKM